MTTYKYNEDGMVVSVNEEGQETFIPPDMGNRHYRELIESGVEIQPYEPDLSITDTMLLDELNRRLALGFDYDFGDQRGVHHFGTTDADMKRWMQEVTPMAQAAINAGSPNAMLAIKTETGPVQLTAEEWFTVLLVSGTTWRQPLWQAYFMIKAIDPKPFDYASDEYWS